MLLLMLEVFNLPGQPHTLMIDKGTEWNDVIPKLPVIQMKSTFNQVHVSQSLSLFTFWCQLLVSQYFSAVEG